jgi:hypothetical protein
LCCNSFLTPEVEAVKFILCSVFFQYKTTTKSLLGAFVFHTLPTIAKVSLSTFKEKCSVQNSTGVGEDVAKTVKVIDLVHGGAEDAWGAKIKVTLGCSWWEWLVSMIDDLGTILREKREREREKVKVRCTCTGELGAVIPLPWGSVTLSKTCLPHNPAPPETFKGIILHVRVPGPPTDVLRPLPPPLAGFMVF